MAFSNCRGAPTHTPFRRRSPALPPNAGKLLEPPDPTATSARPPGCRESWWAHGFCVTSPALPMKRAPLLLIVLCPVLGLTACDDNKPKPEATTSAASAPVAYPSPAAAETPTPPVEPKGPPEALNVLLITVDALRNDMPWTGYERQIAPNLSELAKKGALYTNHYTLASYTAKSVAGMLSSRYPSTLYRNGVFFTTYSKANLFFPELLQEAGVRTLAWHSHMYFGRGKGFDQGFDIWELVPGITFDPQTDNHVTSPKTTELAIELLSKPENTGKQFFAWTHYTDPHDVYVIHEESPDFGKKNRDRYDSEVFYTDLWIGKLLDWASKQSWWEKTALIISSDHGEAFGEHGMYRHAFHVWDVLTRVPLIINAPGVKPMRIDEPRSQIDLAPTILELMGLKAPDDFTGKSLVKEIYGVEEPRDRQPIILDLPEDTNNPQRRAIIQDDYKLIVYGKGWTKLLFNLKEDPGEEKDLSKEQPEVLEKMVALYEKTFSELPLVEPYGGSKLTSGRVANGPMRPPTPPSRPDASSAKERGASTSAKSDE